MTWLGPSLIVTVCPTAFGYGWHAFRRAPDRFWACAALTVSGVGIIGWTIILWSVVAAIFA